MGKTKTIRISVNDFERLYDFEKSSVTTKNMSIGNDEMLPVYIKYSLSIEDAVGFIEDVVLGCFDTEDDTYLPEYEDYMIRRCTLTYYSNFTMPKDHRKAYDLVYGTTAYDEVVGCINNRQYEDILKTISNKIEYLKQQSLSSEHAVLTKISMKMDELTGQIESMFNGVDIKPFAESVVQLVDQIEELPKYHVASAIVDSIGSASDTEFTPKVFNLDRVEV